MANDEVSNLNFSEILTNLKRKYQIIHTIWTEDKNFEAKLRTQIARDSEDFNGLCDEWVDAFSEATNTVWAKKISNTGPKIRFRKQYQCWTHGGKIVQKDLLFDARRCKGTLDIKVLTDNPLTRRKNKHIRAGLNVVVKINFNHLHQVDIKQPFSFFVHQCEPLAEAPKPPYQSNEKLSKLVANMVQKGLNSTQKQIDAKQTLANKDKETVEKTEVIQYLADDHKLINQTAFIKILDNREFKIEDKTLNETKEELIYVPLSNDDHQQIISEPGQQTIMLQNVFPLPHLENVKLDVQQPQLQPFTQLVVSAPQLDVADHFLMFDTSQVIPIASHNLNSHFVQLHNIQNQGQFL